MNPFIVVRSDALQDKELQKSPAVFMTLCAISTMTTRGKDGYCYFKQETISKQLGKSRQALSQHLNKLAELGYLEIIPQTYRGFKSNNAYRLKYDSELTPQNNDASSPCDDASSPCDDASSPCDTTQAHLATKCSYLNAKKEKEPLTRNEFLRAIHGGYKADAFKEWEHLTETEIAASAEACLDFYGSKGEWPKGDPILVVRHWIRGGVQRGNIRKKPKSRDNACRVEQAEWTEQQQKFVEAVKVWKRTNGYWHPDFGAPPDSPDTKVPLEVLNHFKINPTAKELLNA
jgi:DNA-binding transcriptional ArsR family regulator